MTKTFSSRADEGSLAFAEALAREKYGLSYGQYCGTILLDAIGRMGRMPDLPGGEDDPKKERAASFIKGFKARRRNEEIGKMSDEEIRGLIASRYE